MIAQNEVNLQVELVNKTDNRIVQSHVSIVQEGL